MLGEGDAPVVRIERAARFGRSALPTMQVNLAPMIDVVFLLLMYFLLTSQFRPAERALALDVPAPGAASAADPFALPSTPVTIRVRSLGTGPDELTLDVDHPALSIGSEGPLEDRLLGAMLPPDQEFIVEAGSARWEHAVRTISAIRAAGFDRVRIEAMPAGAPEVSP
jgi:biopolymer transport protein ExbD